MTGASLPMTPGRRLALVLGVPLALVIIAWAGLTEVAFAGVGSYPVRLAVPVRGTTVSLSIGAADTQVSQAAGSRLRLTGTARYSLIRSAVSWHATASGVSVTPRCRFPTGICSFSFRAVLPAGRRAYVSTGSGNLALRGLSGPVVAGSGSGNVRASLLTGAVRLRSGSGNITGSALSGARVTVRAASGNIAFTGLTSLNVLAVADSGNVSLVFSAVPDHVTVNVASGNVSLVLPPGPARYQVDASTDSGNRTVTVPATSAPAHVIKVTDGSGNISITN